MDFLPQTTAWCLLGSNLGQRDVLLRRAVFALGDTAGIELIRASSILETAPWGRIDQPPFLNAAVELKTSLEPEALLDRFQAIEAELGRVRTGERWTARTIDLDLALYGDQVIRTERLRVPHEQLSNRAFAMALLLELCPDLRDPERDRLYSELLEDRFRQIAEEDRAARAAVRSGLDLPVSPENSPRTGTARGPLLWNLDALRDLELQAVTEPEIRDADSFPAESEGDTTLCFLYQSRSPEETERLAEAMAHPFKGGEAVALAGNLGAGKTCFARGLARGLGIRSPITSPSYVLVKTYEGRLTLHHADFYRLSGTETALEAKDRFGAPAEAPDLASLGLEDVVDDPGAVVLIEWADRYPHWLEPPFWLVQIAGAGDAPRLILARRLVRHPGETR
ncbi:2-amino-4-hydroxy-6-hydroxymethyldihydropteridine diphosphokinase [bacterium]|nr:2-amino-4-hydroxy-6-hydroxymethyldihydropteridine diphosphokinase [bacterium]